MVIAINIEVCQEGNNPIHCYDKGRIESAIHSAFYPGSHPFAHGGFPSIAGALAFYVCQSHAFADGNKRTAALTALYFLNANGLDLYYPISKNRDDFSNLMIVIASGQIAIDAVKDWFESHIVAFELK